jgi:hypothetical protein
MKKHYQLLLFTLFVCLSSLLNSDVKAQCSGGYTQAQLNWDNLDYYYKTINAAPYGCGGSCSYVSDAMEQTQRFAIGTKSVTIATSAAGIVKGENKTHTGDVSVDYSGADAQFLPTANNQTITLTFSDDVANVRFTLYDVDAGQRINFAAVNAANAAQTINVQTYTGSVITITNNNTATAYITASATAVANNVNTGTATITVAGPVKTITLTIQTIGTDAVFWLSDINACVTGSFPVNWHQAQSNRPLVGPTQNQPDYFIVTPDNRSVYMMDPATGRCWWLFSEAASIQYVNSFGYDPVNKYLYYVTDGTASPSTNKSLKRYNFNTESIQTVAANISTLLNIPTFDQGVESAAAAFYNNILYLGIEGGRHGTGASTVTRSSIIWAIDFDASQNPISASQVLAIPAYINGTDSSYHDWADFIIRDGMLFDFNTARSGTSPNFKYKYSAYHHYNMMTGNMDAYFQNPNLNNTYTGQAGLTWNGQLYFLRDSVGLYNENGTNSNTRYRAVVQNVPGEAVPPAWAGGAGDASDPFRPKCDFGDAPASYDPYSNPAVQSPAAHERSELIRLGATWDREFWKRGTSGTDDVDDGLAFTPIMAPGGGGYVAQVSAFNNSGSPATLIAWLDYNGNGTFDASEAITPITVPSSASAQNFYLYWPSTPNTFTNGQHTYLRIRITAASAGMTTAHATGYFTNGEVEDYRVLVDNFPLATHLLDFTATTAINKVQLTWKSTEDLNTYEYVVERSKDNVTWQKIGSVTANGNNGTYDYHYDDLNPEKGYSYYRIRIIESSGMNRFSAVRKVLMKDISSTLSVSPNPAKENISVKFELPTTADVSVSVLNQQGAVILSATNKGLAGWNKMDFSLPAQLPQGTYVVKVTIGELSISKKIIVRR